MADHLILKRDCIELMRDELPAGFADCIFTDPPYDGMNSHLSYGRARSTNTSSYVWYEPLTNQRFPDFLEACKRPLKEQVFFCMFDNYSLLELGSKVGEVFDTKGIIVWDKGTIGPGYYFRRQHEMIVFATRGGRKLLSRSHPDIVRADRVRGKDKYPTEKPVELVRHCLEAALGRDGVVLDPFGGSGSTSAAAEELGIHSVYIDIAEQAVDRAERRFRQMGGRVHRDPQAWLRAAGIS